MNFGTVYRQTFKSTFNQPSTSILIAIFVVLMGLLWLLVPAVTMKSGGFTGGDFIAVYLRMMFYVCVMISTIFIVVISTNANELAEMTFTISRPVSRRTYLSAKALCVTTIVGLMFLYMIGMYIGCDFIVRHFNHDNSPFQWSNNHINWATVIVPLFLSYCYAIYLPFVLRTFFSDKIISLFIVLTTVLAYQTYSIACAIASSDNDNLYGLLIIPSCVYGVGSILTIILSYTTVNKVNIKV